MSKIYVYNIDWDTDDNDKKSTLPDELLLNTEYLDIQDDENINEIEDVVSKYLSGEYDCHRGFSFERV